MGNALAYLMLAIWPVICLVMFRTLSVQKALIWSILGGYLFLPPLTEFNLPLVPAMDKTSIPNLSVLLIMMFAMREKLVLWPRSRVAGLLVLGLHPDLDLPLLLEHPQQHGCAQPGADGSQIARQLRGLKGTGKALTHVCGGGGGRLAQRWCATQHASQGGPKPRHDPAA